MPTPAAYRRDTTLAGGIEGGMSTGELLVVRAAMKPLATLNVPVLETVDTATKEATVSFKERTDVTAVPAMGVVAETMVALVLAAEAQRKFGGDSVAEFVRNADGVPRHAAVSATDRRPPHSCSSGMMGVGQDDRRARRWPRGSARRLVDSDELIEARTGRPFARSSSADGEPAFRVLETDALVEALAEPRAAA